MDTNSKEYVECNNLINDNNFAEVLVHCDRFEENNNLELASFWRGLIALELKDHFAALENLTKCIRINEKNFKAWSNIGVVYDRLEKPEKSLYAHKKAYELFPSDRISILNYGTSLGQNFQKDYEAEKIFRKGLDQYSNDKEMAYSLAVTYQRQGLWYEASEIGAKYNLDDIQQQQANHDENRYLRKGFSCTECGKNWKDYFYELEFNSFAFIYNYKSENYHIPTHPAYCLTCKRFVLTPSNVIDDYKQTPYAYNLLEGHKTNCLENLKKPKPKGIFRRIDPYEQECYEKHLRYLSIFPDDLFLHESKFSDEFLRGIPNSHLENICLSCCDSHDVLRFKEPRLNPDSNRTDLTHRQIEEDSEIKCDGKIHSVSTPRSIWQSPGKYPEDALLLLNSNLEIGNIISFSNYYNIDGGRIPQLVIP